MSRGQRTSRIWIVVRTGLAIYVIIAVPFALIWLLTGVALFLDWPSLMGVIAGVAILMLIGCVGTRIGGWLGSLWVMIQNTGSGAKMVLIHILIICHGHSIMIVGPSG